MFHCESETTLFGLPQEDTTRNQWLSYIYNTLPEKFNPSIRLSAAQRKNPWSRVALICSILGTKQMLWKYSVLFLLCLFTV